MDAGGNVAVTAQDETDTTMIAGTVALGLPFLEGLPSRSAWAADAVLGTVIDPSGAPVPAATITA